MIGLDTNVLVRYLAQDDVRQSALATYLIETELGPAQPGFVSLVVLAEMCWVLHKLYAASDDELVTTVSDMLNTPQFHLERREVVLATIRHRRSSKGAKAGFVDTLVAQLARAEGCTHTLSFDKGAVRSAGMRLLA
jgi:predicted nucleic-acid-binding protein